MVFVLLHSLSMRPLEAILPPNRNGSWWTLIFLIFLLRVLWSFYCCFTKGREGLKYLNRLGLVAELFEG